MGSVYQATNTAAESLRYSEHEDATPKAAGNKRLFSTRQSRQLEEEEGNYTNYNTLSHEPSEPRRHSDKRHRNEDWPLPSSRPSSPSSRPPLRARHAPNSPSSRRRAVSAQRPSKFVEGSMNDRISAVPPIPYLEDADEDLLSEYDAIEPSRGRKIARTRKFTSKRNPSVSGEASISSHNIEGGRNSIYKFGKSIAASFNPSNWKIWSKVQQHAEEETAQMKLLRERQSKAERIYRELKESGQFRDSAVVFPNSNLQIHEQVLKPEHDSGVELEIESTKNSHRKSREMSTEEKRMGRIFLEPPVLNGSVGGSPVSHISSSQAHSNNSSPNKSFHFKKASLSNIKKSFAGNSSTNLSEDGQHQARRIPSRKDLQKQQKLVKRVSDLEGKLQSARQQLSAALGEPLPGDISQVSLSSQGSHVLEEFTAPPAPPLHLTPMERVTRKPFVPGALASLPSERLLAGYVDNEEEEEEDNKIGMAVTVDHQQQSDEKRKKSGTRNNASSAWLDGPLHRRRSLSRDRPMRSVERDEDTTPTVKKSFASTKSEVATTISEPTTKDSDPNDSDYDDGAAEPDAKEEEEEIDEVEKTPKPQPKISPPAKKRKSRFEGYADDGGAYKPEEDEESDHESEVKKLASTRRQKSIAASTPGSGKQAPKIILNNPRKLQKISPTQAKDPNTDGPPTRAPPPPPAETQSQTSKHPSRTSSLKATMKSPPPNRLSKSKPPPMPTGRQQSSSPPPSSAFTGVPELSYKKPSLQRQNPRNQVNDTQLRTFADEGDDLEYSAHPQDDNVPPMPALPPAIRLSSGEIILTQPQSTTSASKPSSLSSGNPRVSRGSGSTVSTSKTSNASKVSKNTTTGKLVKERRESKRLEKKRESLAAALEEGKLGEEKEKFEWPEDCF